MKNERPLAAGVHAALAHRRLAIVLWLAIAVPAGLVCTPLGRLTRLFDESPFREASPEGVGLVGNAVVAPPPSRASGDSSHSLLAATLAASLLIQFFLTGGVLRTLMTGIPRPVFRRVVAESAALFKPNLWAGARYLIGARVLAGPPRRGTGAALQEAGRETSRRTPSGPRRGSCGFSWRAILVFYLVSLKFDLARIALARSEARNARGAYKLAKKRMRGARGRVLTIALFWTVVAVAIQALFTNIGVRMNPQTGAGVFWLVVVRQIGFVISAMARVGFWASLIRFDEVRRDELTPPVYVPVPWEVPPAEPAPPPLPA